MPTDVQLRIATQVLPGLLAQNPTRTIDAQMVDLRYSLELASALVQLHAEKSLGGGARPASAIRLGASSASGLGRPRPAASTHAGVSGCVARFSGTPTSQTREAQPQSLWPSNPITAKAPHMRGFL